MKWILHFPAGIILAFILFLILNLFFIYISFNHPDDLVTNDYYSQDQAYQERIESHTRGLNLETPPFVIYSPGDPDIVINIPVTLGDMQGGITLYRPGDAELDLEIPIDGNGDGKQSISIKGLAEGLWILQMMWISQGQNYYLEWEIILTNSLAKRPTTFRDRITTTEEE